MAREGSEWNIYYVHPLLVASGDHWAGHFERIRDMGFGAVCLAPIFAAGADQDLFLTSDFDQTDPRIFAGPLQATVAKLVDLCSGSGLRLILDFRLNCVAADGVAARQHPDLFLRSVDQDVVDPRHDMLPPNACPTRFGDAQGEADLVEFFGSRLIPLIKAGVSGFRLVGMDRVPARFLRAFLQKFHSECAGCKFFGWTPGQHWSAIASMEDSGLDGTFASTPWWDGRRHWLVDEYNLLRRVAPIVIGMPEAPFEERLGADGRARKETYRRALRIAAATSTGLLIPMGFELGARHRMDSKGGAVTFDTLRAEAPFDIAHEIRCANELAGTARARDTLGEMRMVSVPGSVPTAILRADASDIRAARRATLVLINASSVSHMPPAMDPLPGIAGSAFANPRPVEAIDPAAVLAPGEVRLVALAPTRAVADRTKKGARALNSALKSSRIAFEHLSPCVGGGSFPVKRVVGETVVVEVDIITDGHDVVAAELLWRAADENSWSRAPLRQVGNDRWQGAFTPNRVGRHLFTVEAWRDDYATLAHEIEVKHKAGDRHSVGIAGSATLPGKGAPARAAMQLNSDRQRATWAGERRR